MKENVIPSNLKMQDIFSEEKGVWVFFTAAPSCLKLTRQLRKKVDVRPTVFSRTLKACELKKPGSPVFGEGREAASLEG